MQDTRHKMQEAAALEPESESGHKDYLGIIFDKLVFQLEVGTHPVADVVLKAETQISARTVFSPLCCGRLTSSSCAILPVGIMNSCYGVERGRKRYRKHIMCIGFGHPHAGTFSFQKVCEGGRQPQIVRSVIMQMKSHTRTVDFCSITGMNTHADSTFKLSRYF